MYWSTYWYRYIWTRQAIFVTMGPGNFEHHRTNRQLMFLVCCLLTSLGDAYFNDRTAPSTNKVYSYIQHNVVVHNILFQYIYQDSCRTIDTISGISKMSDLSSSSMPHCLFEKIVAGDIPCHKIYEDEMVLSFLDINPLSPGVSVTNLFHKLTCLTMLFTSTTFLTCRNRALTGHSQEKVRSPTIRCCFYCCVSNAVVCFFAH